MTETLETLVVEFKVTGRVEGWRSLAEQVALYERFTGAPMRSQGWAKRKTKRFVLNFQRRLLWASLGVYPLPTNVESSSKWEGYDR